MFRSRITPYAFALLLLASAAAWFFWQPLTARLTHWAVKGYCRYYLDLAFSTQDVRWRDGELIFIEPSLRANKSTAPWLTAHAAQIKIAIKPYLLDQRLSLQATVDAPLVEITSNTERQPLSFLLFSSNAGPPSVDTDILISEGLLVFKGPATTNESRLAFRGQAVSGKGSFTITTQNQGTLTCSYEGGDWTLACKAFDLPDAHYALKVLGINMLPINLHQGVLEGEVNIEWDEEDVFDVYGALQVDEGIFSNKTGDLHGYIPKARLTLNDSSLAGEFSLSKGAYLEYTQEGKTPISLSQVEGTLSMPAYDRCAIEARGLCTHHGNTFVLNIDGQVQVPAQNTATCDLEVVLENESRQPIRACISSYREGSGGHSQCAVDVRNIGASEWDLLMLLLGTQDIGLDPYTLRNGQIDAKIVLDLENFKARKINIEQFVAKHIAFDMDLSATSFKIDRADGSLSLDLSVPNVLETLQATFNIEGGMVRFPALDNQTWQLSNLLTKLAVENGVFKKSFVEADFMGMRGLIEVDWAANKSMNLHFKGKVRDLAALASANIQQGVIKKFKDDDLSIVADVRRVHTGVNVESTIEIIPNRETSPETLLLGFTLEKNSGAQHLLAPSVLLFSHRLGSDVALAIVEQLTGQKDEATTEWLKKELRIAGFTLKNGWFTAKSLPTGKYIEPFFFRDGQMSLSGDADFQGRFDCDGVAIEYQGKNLVLENDGLAFDMGNIGAGQPARHYFDFVRDTDHGIVPVSNGSYFEKNSGLLFAGVEGSMVLRDKTICLPAMTTVCNNVVFAGRIDVDYSSPEKKVFDVTIETSSMEGSYNNVKDLLAHFNPTVSQVELPLTGKVSLLPGGGSMQLAFRPHGCSVKTLLRGSMECATLDLPLEGAAFENISLEFAYDHASNELRIIKMTGDLFFNNSTEFAMSMRGGSVAFFDLEESKAVFDLPFYRREEEVFRLTGKTENTVREDGELSSRLVVDNEKSHYAGMHPDKVELVLGGASIIETAAFHWACDLSTLFADLRKVGGSTIALYAPHVARQLNGLEPPTGKIDFNLQYDHLNRQFNFTVEGHDVCVGDAYYRQILFAGAKKRHLWSVEQLQMDNVSIAADILPEPNGYRVNFLGMRYGELLLLGLEGFYNHHNAVFDGTINLLELDFSRLGQWKSFHELVSDYHPQGQMKGTGSLRITLDEEWPPQVEVKVTTSLRNCILRGLHFADSDNAVCEYLLRDMLILRHCQSGLKCADSGYTQGLFGVETAIYDFKKEELALQGLHFHAHAANLDWIATHLESVFPEAISPAVGKIIRHIKEDEAFRGSMDLKISDEASDVVVRLPHGRYRLGDKEHEVNNFVLHWDKKNLQVVTQYRFQDTLYWMAAKSTSPDIDAGDIYVSAYPLDPSYHPTLNECLCISWYLHPDYGMVVEKALGTLPGVYVNLARDRHYPMNPHSWHLDGNIVLDPKTGSHILPSDIVKALDSWNISRNYDLKGKWIFMLDEQHEGELYFRGRLMAKEAILKGYVLGDISAELICSPTRVDVNNLAIQDAAGKLTVKTANMVKNENEEWWVYIPQVVGEGFRPCLLRDTALPPGPVKPLVINAFEINDVFCRSNDLSTMTGHGSLHFNNSSKKPMHNPLLAIPAEILSRIGLNLDVLNPVTGTIFFNLENYKVRLTKFKDIYSEGKLSKFYLSHGGAPSFVDLDGNVQVQVRMKQYNLLFKLAELFTVSIHGTLTKPVYTLQKQ